MQSKSELYEPREDSYLILKHIKEYAKGEVLDMGTGSGILAKEAAKYAKVTAADINPAAIQENKDITFIQSDLFENISGTFDLITFNPPYLPIEEQDKGLEDPALHGGKKGYETIARFLAQAPAHLKPEGTILLLFSSHSGKEQVEQEITNNHLKGKQIDKQHIFFEDLYVYKIWKE